MEGTRIDGHFTLFRGMLFFQADSGESLTGHLVAPPSDGPPAEIEAGAIRLYCRPAGKEFVPDLPEDLAGQEVVALIALEGLSLPAKTLVELLRGTDRKEECVMEGRLELRCPACGREPEVDARYCGGCGRDLEGMIHTYPCCGRQSLVAPERMSWCTRCGADLRGLRPNVPVPPPPAGA